MTKVSVARPFMNVVEKATAVGNCQSLGVHRVNVVNAYLYGDAIRGWWRLNR